MIWDRVFQPNRRTSRSELCAWAGAWLSLLVVLWAIAGKGVLPLPLEVLSALGSLFEQGLLRHLASSLYTSLLALAWTTAISTALCYAAVLPALRPLALLVGNVRFWGFAGVG